MKKKSTRKLQLTKETLVNLENLRRAQGGANPTNTDCVSACPGLECEDEINPN